MDVTIVDVQENTVAYTKLMDVARQLNQAQYIQAHEHYIDASLLLGASMDQQCVGFLRCLIQVIGREHGRTPITVAGQALREGYIEAFGVVPSYRRRGIGQQMQERAIAICQVRGCYQIRSRSPITSYENYALKLKMGYAIHPSHENDSYYFIKTLARP